MREGFDPDHGPHSVGRIPDRLQSASAMIPIRRDLRSLPPAPAAKQPLKWIAQGHMQGARKDNL